MTVRTSAPITFGPHDFQRTDRGITWGIKVTSTSDASFVMVFVQGADGKWLPDQTQAAQLDAAFETAISRGGPVINWFRDVLLPKLNAWLREKFPPLDATAPPPAPTTFPEQADALIQGLRITVHADGTLTAA